MASHLLYQRIAQHYRSAIGSGVLTAGDQMPSVRALTRVHKVSLSTALQACRSLEDEGLLEARPRSGYFVRRPRTTAGAAGKEPELDNTFEAAQYVGIHDRVSAFVAHSQRHTVTTDFAAAYAAPELYPAAALHKAAIRALRRHPDLLATPVAPQGDPGLRTVLARRALDAGMRLSGDDIVITQGCIEALNIALRASMGRRRSSRIECLGHSSWIECLGHSSRIECLGIGTLVTVEDTLDLAPHGCDRRPAGLGCKPLGSDQQIAKRQQLRRRATDACCPAAPGRPLRPRRQWQSRGRAATTGSRSQEARCTTTSDVYRARALFDSELLSSSPSHRPIKAADGCRGTRTIK